MGKDSSEVAPTSSLNAALQQRYWPSPKVSVYPSTLVEVYNIDCADQDPCYRVLRLKTCSHPLLESRTACGNCAIARATISLWFVSLFKFSFCVSPISVSRTRPTP